MNFRLWSFEFSGQSSNVSMNVVGKFMFTKEGIFLNRPIEEFSLPRKNINYFFFLIGFKDKINYRDLD